jgi:GAF domain-containing protein
MFGFFKKKDQDAAGDIQSRLEFSQGLQAVTNKIHAADEIDELMLDLSPDICKLFNCDRLTLYAVSKDRKFIFSKVKTGIATSQDLVLPIDESSVAGYAALSERTLRIADVYDTKELQKYSAELKFNQEVDRLTGYRTKQMLVAPIFNPATHDVIGVVQLLNNRNDGAFTQTAEEGLQELCKTIGVAFMQRLKAAARLRSKYEPLVVDSIISQAELELAINWARRKNVDIEDALADEFQVPIAILGQTLAKTFNLTYEPFKADRKKPTEVLKKIDRRFVEKHHAIPVEEDGTNIVVMALDPESANLTRVLREAFPYNNLFFRVTTRREFKQTVDQILGAAG